MAWSTESCHAKLVRADTHLKALGDLMDAYAHSNPYKTVYEFDPETSWHNVVLRQVREPSALFGILVGEIAHHLRSTLDHIAWQLANIDGRPPYPDRVQFPIFTPGKEPADFFALPSLDGMRDVHKTILEEIQPYHAGHDKTFLGRLAAINNTDKHKVLHTIAMLAEDVAPNLLEALPGYQIAGAAFKPGEIALEGDTEIGAVLIRPTDPEPHVRMKGQFSFGIAFGDPQTTLYGAPAGGLLRKIKEMVEGILATFDRPGANGVPPWP